jgi:periplasmic protein CpxP/Spy
MNARTNRFLAGLLVAGTLALPAAALAHRGDGFGYGPMRGNPESHRMMGLRALDLTEAQRDQVFKLRHEQAPALREKMQAARKAHGELRALATATTFDGARARELADAQAKAMAEAALLRAETMNRMMAVLTPEQRATLDELRAQRGPRGHRR